MGVEELRGLFIQSQDIVDAELEEKRLDRDLVAKFSSKHRGNVRLALGKYYTQEEWEEKRKRILAKPLP